MKKNQVNVQQENSKKRIDLRLSHRSTGFSLIEVLIAFFVLSVGALGLSLIHI